MFPSLSFNIYHPVVSLPFILLPPSSVFIILNFCLFMGGRVGERGYYTMVHSSNASTARAEARSM